MESNEVAYSYEKYFLEVYLFGPSFGRSYYLTNKLFNED